MLIKTISQNFLLNQNTLIIEKILKIPYSTNKKNYPAVFLDVDGVLKKGNESIPKAKEAIELIRKYNIPLQIVSNGCGDTEESKSINFSKILKLNKKDYFKPNEIILSHTPMKPNLQKYSNMKNGIPLIFGVGKLYSLMKSYNVKKFITGDEYLTLYYKDIINKDYIKDFKIEKEKDKIKKKVEERLGYKINNYIPINSIFQVSDVENWEINFQICSLLLLSKNGIPFNNINLNKDNFKLNYHIANPDEEFMDNFPIPRYCGGSFLELLLLYFEKKYGKRFNVIKYGKPSALIYNYAKEYCKENNKDKNISKFYMIGDNPLSDIQGAILAKINSILVRTGIFRNKDNDEKFPADLVKNDVYDCIEYIIKEFNLKI